MYCFKTPFLCNEYGSEFGQRYRIVIIRRIEKSPDSLKNIWRDFCEIVWQLKNWRYKTVIISVLLNVLQNSRNDAVCIGWLILLGNLVIFIKDNKKYNNNKFYWPDYAELNSKNTEKLCNLRLPSENLISRHSRTDLLHPLAYFWMTWILIIIILLSHPLIICSGYPSKIC